MNDYKREFLENEFHKIVSTSQENLEVLRNTVILVTGGSGFIGSWLVDVLRVANSSMRLNCEIYTLSRHQRSDSFKILCADNSIHFIEGDIRDPGTLPNIPFNYVFHAATPSTSSSGTNNPRNIYEITQIGMKNLLASFKRTKAHPRIINLSSGAAMEFDALSHNEKSWENIENLSPSTAYALSKRLNEISLSEANKEDYLSAVNARIFATYGPRLYLDEHFAIGNFMNNVLKGENIEVRGNAETVRSYLYINDLIGWLFSCLSAPSDSTQQIGSLKPVTISELAFKVAKLRPGTQVIFKPNQEPVSIYIPTNKLIGKGLDFHEHYNLDLGLKYWWEWLKA